MELASAGAAARVVSGEFRLEDSECGADEARSAVWVMAGSASGDLARPALKSRSVVGRAAPSGLLESLGDCREAVGTRSALAGALIGQVAGDACGFADSAGGLGQGDDRSHTEGAAVLLERRRVEG